MFWALDYIVVLFLGVEGHLKKLALRITWPTFWNASVCRARSRIKPPVVHHRPTCILTDMARPRYFGVHSAHDRARTTSMSDTLECQSALVS
jgi:hypothetical protein